MGDHAALAGDPAESKMGDAGKGSFEQSQEQGQAQEAARGSRPEARDEDWHDKLKEELTGKDGPKEGRKDVSGPGRGRF
jgi:hypothetical protein